MSRWMSLAELPGGQALVNTAFQGLQLLVRAGFHHPAAMGHNPMQYRISWRVSPRLATRR